MIKLTKILLLITFVMGLVMTTTNSYTIEQLFSFKPELYSIPDNKLTIEEIHYKKIITKGDYIAIMAVDKGYGLLGSGLWDTHSSPDENPKYYDYLQQSCSTIDQYAKGMEVYLSRGYRYLRIITKAQEYEFFKQQHIIFNK